MAPGGAEPDPARRAPRRAPRDISATPRPDVRRAAGRVGRVDRAPRPAPAVRSSIRPVGVAAGGAAVGGVLGLEVAMRVGTPPVVALAAVVAGLVAGHALGRSVGALPLQEHRNRAVIGAALLVIVGLGAVAHTPHLDVRGRSVPVHWLPDALMLVALVLAGAVLWRRRGLATPDLMGSAAAFVVLPVAILLVGSRVPDGGARLGPAAGRSLTVGARLLDGHVASDDLWSVGGPLRAVRPLPGLAWVDDSAWGARAGWALWLAPLTWLALAVVVGRLTRFRVPVVGLLVVLVAAGDAIAGGALAPAALAMVPAWLVVAAVAGLGHGGPRRAAALVAAVVGGAVLSPATIPYGLAALAVVAGGRVAPVAGRLPALRMPAGSATATLLLGAAIQGIGVLAGLARPSDWWPQIVILGFLALDRAVGAIDAASAFGTGSRASGSVRSLAVRFVLPVAVLVVALVGEGIVRLADDADRPGLRLGRSLEASADRGGSGRLRYDGPAALGLTPRSMFVLRRVLDAAGARNGLVDLSRAGVLYWYALGERPVVSPLDLGSVDAGASERAFVARLRSLSKGAGPAVVAWRTEGAGVDRIDGLPVPVARPIVAAWMIGRYVPYASVEGTQVWVRRADAQRLPDARSLGADPASPVLDAYACDWRGASLPSPDDAPRVRTELPFAEVRAVRIAGRAARGGIPASKVTAFLGDAELGSGDVHLPTDGRTNTIVDGFSFLVDAAGLTASTPGLRVVAEGPDGSTWQLGLRGAAPSGQGDGFVDPSALGSGWYSAEPLSGTDVRVWRLDADGAARRRGRLVVATTGDGATVRLGTDPAIANGAVTFRVPAGGTERAPLRTTVPVGACTQWVLGPERQYLVVTGDTVVRSVGVT